MILLTKVSDEQYFKILDEVDYEKVIEEYGECIVNRSMFYDEDLEMLQDWFNVSLEMAKEISQCKFEFKIYDDYYE